MTCAESQNLFSEYLEGQIAGTVQQGLVEHLQACPACAQKLKLMRLVRVRLSKLGRKHLPDTFSFEMRRALLAEMNRENIWLNRLRALLSPRPQTVWSCTGVAWPGPQTKLTTEKRSSGSACSRITSACGAAACKASMKPLLEPRVST